MGLSREKQRRCGVLNVLVGVGHAFLCSTSHYTVLYTFRGRGGEPRSTDGHFWKLCVLSSYSKRGGRRERELTWSKVQMAKKVFFFSLTSSVLLASAVVALSFLLFFDMIYLCIRLPKGVAYPILPIYEKVVKVVCP